MKTTVLWLIVIVVPLYTATSDEFMFVDLLNESLDPNGTISFEEFTELHEVNEDVSSFDRFEFIFSIDETSFLLGFSKFRPGLSMVFQALGLGDGVYQLGYYIPEFVYDFSGSVITLYLQDDLYDYYYNHAHITITYITPDGDEYSLSQYWVVYPGRPTEIKLPESVANETSQIKDVVISRVFMY